MATNATAIPRQRWLRIIPVAFIMYTFAFVDRNNIGFGIPGIEKSFGIGATVAGLVAGLFFVGYVFLQIPGGQLAMKWSAKRYIFFSLIVWGCLATLSGFVQNLPELLAARFLLGVAEGGVWPATLVLIARWFPIEERGRANSYWIACTPVAGIITPLISGWILTWTDWRMLFILEGILPLIWAVVWWLLIDDSPDTAKWISPAERDYINRRFNESIDRIPQTTRNSWADALKNGLVWWLVAAYFLLQVGTYGIALWLPVIVKNMTKQGFGMVGVLVALPSVAGLIGIYINSNHSDRTGERKAHAGLAALLAGVALLVSALVGTSSVVIAILFLIIAQGFLSSFSGIFWTLPPLFVGKASLGSSMGLINALGNLGGFLGPYLIGYLFTMTGSNKIGLMTLAAALAGAGLLTVFFRYGSSSDTRGAVATGASEVQASRLA